MYRLSNTDIEELMKEKSDLEKIMELLQSILDDPNKLNGVIKEEMRKIKREYGTERKTIIEEEIAEIKIDTADMIPKEDVVVVVTKEGYVKRVSLRSYSASDEETTLKENDYIIGLYNMNTLDTLLVFTDNGNYLHIPVYEIPEVKWKDLGKHASNIISMDSSDTIIEAIPVYDFSKDLYITSFSKNGMVKRTKLEEFKVQRYIKAMSMMNLKENDKVVSVTMSNNQNVFVATKNGYGLWYDVNEISVVGIKATGVKSINLKNDEVVSGLLFNSNSEYITILTDKGTGKRLKLTDFEKGSRGNRGLLLMKEIKSNPSKIIKVYIENNKKEIGVVTEREIKKVKLTEISIMDRYSNGSYIVKDRIINSYLIINSISDEIEETEEKIVTNPEKSLKEIDDRIMTIDDLLVNIEDNK